MNLLRTCCGSLACAAILWLSAADFAHAQLAASDPLAQLAAQLPRTAAEFTPEHATRVEQSARQVDHWFAELALFRGLMTHDAGLQRLNQLLTLQQQVDQLLEENFAQRGSFIGIADDQQRRTRVQSYLRTSSALIDLSGRVRYTLYDAITGATLRVLNEPQYLVRLVDLLIEHRSAVGAGIIAQALHQPEPESSRAPRERLLGRRTTQQDLSLVQRKILQLIALTGESSALPDLVTFIRAEETPPELVLAGAQTIRQIGVPQEPRPGQDSTLPDPPITARTLLDVVHKIDPRQLGADQVREREQLVRWLSQRAQHGLAEERYQLGSFAVQPGDWLLMRNPSPYNRFTDLSPGLFTHVGVITSETADDGIRRMVLVDLPERGDTIQTVPIDTFVLRTLHYVVVRHEDPAVTAKMGEVARSIVGNPSQFDLNFRTARVEALRGETLTGRKIHTYCAGLLLLCAQETDAPRSDFFPVPEYPAGGKTEANLAQLGLTFGDNFISPTGAFFSPRLKVVGRRQAMYDPSRETEEAVFDHFADSLIDRTLTPSPDLFQSLRLKLAEAGKGNPLLARALASAVGVNEEMDLVAAARTGAVVEALDEIAHRASDGFLNAREALLAGPIELLPQRGYSAEDVAAVRAYRQRHAELFQQLVQGTLTPRQLRLELVDYYIEKGKSELDARFFSTSAAPPEDASGEQ